MLIWHDCWLWSEWLLLFHVGMRRTWASLIPSPPPYLVTESRIYVVSWASRIFLYLRWEEWEVEKNSLPLAPSTGDKRKMQLSCETTVHVLSLQYGSEQFIRNCHRNTNNILLTDVYSAWGGEVNLYCRCLLNPLYKDNNSTNDLCFQLHMIDCPLCPHFFSIYVFKYESLFTCEAWYRSSICSDQLSSWMPSGGIWTTEDLLLSR